MERKFLLLMIGGSLAFVYSSAQDAYPPSVRMKVEDMSRYTLEEKASNDKMYALAVPGNGYGYAEDIRMQSYLQEDKEDYWFISAKTNLLFVNKLRSVCFFMTFRWLILITWWLHEIMPNTGCT